MPTVTLSRIFGLFFLIVSVPASFFVGEWAYYALGGAWPGFMALTLSAAYAAFAVIKCYNTITEMAENLEALNDTMSLYYESRRREAARR